MTYDHGNEIHTILIQAKWLIQHNCDACPFNPFRHLGLLAELEGKMTLKYSYTTFPPINDLRHDTKLSNLDKIDQLSANVYLSKQRNYS